MQVREYVVRRLLKLPLVLIAVTLLVFALSRLGGSPIGIYLQHDMSQAEVAQLEERYGVNDPLPTQYLAWLGGVLRGDLGWSGVAVAPVSEVLPARFVATMELATAGAVIAIGLGVGLGDVRRLPAQQAGRPHHPRHHRERRQPSPVLVRPAGADPLLPGHPDRPAGAVRPGDLRSDHPLHGLLHARRRPEPEPPGLLGLRPAPRAARLRARLRRDGRDRPDGPLLVGRGDG